MSTPEQQRPSPTFPPGPGAPVPGAVSPADGPARHAQARPVPVPPPVDVTAYGTGAGPVGRSARRPEDHPPTAPAVPVPATGPLASTTVAAAPDGHGPVPPDDPPVGTPARAGGSPTPWAGERPAGSGTAARTAAADGDRDAGSRGDDLFPEPNAPRTAHAGTHVLGALLGLVLCLPAAGVLLLGQSWVLMVQVDGWDASLDVPGIVLAASGALLIGGLLLLGVWTAAVPVTAGTVLGALGGTALLAPGVARIAAREALELLGADAWSLTVSRMTVVATSGTLLAVGALLLAGGLAAALARRHGVRLGAFRERNRVPGNPRTTNAPVRTPGDQD